MLLLAWGLGSIYCNSKKKLHNELIYTVSQYLDQNDCHFGLLAFVLWSSLVNKHKRPNKINLALFFCTIPASLHSSYLVSFLCRYYNAKAIYRFFKTKLRSNLMIKVQFSINIFQHVGYCISSISQYRAITAERE